MIKKFLALTLIGAVAALSPGLGCYEALAGITMEGSSGGQIQAVGNLRLADPSAGAALSEIETFSQDGAITPENALSITNLETPQARLDEKPTPASARTFTSASENAGPTAKAVVVEAAAASPEAAFPAPSTNRKNLAPLIKILQNATSATVGDLGERIKNIFVGPGFSGFGPELAFESAGNASFNNNFEPVRSERKSLLRDFTLKASIAPDNATATTPAPADGNGQVKTEKSDVIPTITDRHGVSHPLAYNPDLPRDSLFAIMIKGLFYLPRTLRRMRNFRARAREIINNVPDKDLWWALYRLPEMRNQEGILRMQNKALINDWKNASAVKNASPADYSQSSLGNRTRTRIFGIAIDAEEPARQYQYAFAQNIHWWAPWLSHFMGATFPETVLAVALRGQMPFPSIWVTEEARHGPILQAVHNATRDPQQPPMQQIGDAPRLPYDPAKKGNDLAKNILAHRDIAELGAATTYLTLRANAIKGSPADLALEGVFLDELYHHVTMAAVMKWGFGMHSRWRRIFNDIYRSLKYSTPHMNDYRIHERFFTTPLAYAEIIYAGNLADKRIDRFLRSIADGTGHEIIGPVYKTQDEAEEAMEKGLHTIPKTYPLELDPYLTKEKVAQLQERFKKYKSRPLNKTWIYEAMLTIGYSILGAAYGAIAWMCLLAPLSLINSGHLIETFAQVSCIIAAAICGTGIFIWNLHRHYIGPILGRQSEIKGLGKSYAAFDPWTGDLAGYRVTTTLWLPKLKWLAPFKFFSKMAEFHLYYSPEGKLVGAMEINARKANRLSIDVIRAVFAWLDPSKTAGVSPIASADENPGVILHQIQSVENPSGVSKDWRPISQLPPIINATMAETTAETLALKMRPKRDQADIEDYISLERRQIKASDIREIIQDYRQHKLANPQYWLRTKGFVVHASPRLDATLLQKPFAAGGSIDILFVPNRSPRVALLNEQNIAVYSSELDQMSMLQIGALFDAANLDVLKLLDAKKDDLSVEDLVRRLNRSPQYQANPINVIQD